MFDLNNVEHKVVALNYYCQAEQAASFDVHRATASKMFNVPYDKVTPEQRKIAKRRNYISMYKPNVEDK